MAKTRTQYICQNCGRTAARPLGRCPQCSAWNSMVEEVVARPSAKAKRRPASLAGESAPQRLADIGGDVEERSHSPSVNSPRCWAAGSFPARSS